MDDVAEKVQNILEKAREEVKSVQVEEKDVQLEYDLGNLVVEDKNTLDQNQLKSPDGSDQYLRSLARDGIQALLTKVWDLPTQRVDNTVYATLPKPTIRIPREKRVPPPKQLTKWEEFAKEKGINKKKKDKKLWDDVLKQWIPRYGYKKVQAEKEKNWVREVPVTSDPYEDQFAKAAELKKENIAKNEYQRLRNIARNSNVKIPSVGVTGNEFTSTKDLGVAAHHAKHATASLGKFQPRLKDEKPSKGVGKKRKSKEEANMDGQQEKKRNINLFDKIEKPELNLDAAMHRQIKDENVLFDKEKKGGKKHARRSKMGGRHRTPSDYKAIKLGKGIHRNDTKDRNKIVSTTILGQKVRGKASLVELASMKGSRKSAVIRPKRRKSLRKRK